METLQIPVDLTQSIITRLTLYGSYCTFSQLASMSSLDRAAELGQDLRKREFKDQSWLGLKTRSRDATLSRHKGPFTYDVRNIVRIFDPWGAIQ